MDTRNEDYFKRWQRYLVLERGSDDPNDPAYRDRTMTLNGKVISKGAVSRGDTGAKGTETYLLPWFWDAKTGDPVKSEDEKFIIGIHREVLANGIFLIAGKT